MKDIKKEAEKHKDLKDKFNKREIKKTFDKIWFILWKDDSFKGWLISLIFLFFLVQFIIFPLLRFVTGTTLPLAIVETCSMYHNKNVFSNFDEWFNENKADKYLKYNITKEEFEKFPLKNGFSKGDLILMTGVKSENLKVGDIIAFDSGVKSTPIVHRIIGIREENGKRIFTTMGDNNQGILKPNNNQWGIDEGSIKEEQIKGKVNLRIIPYIGWIKLIFFETNKSPSDRGFCKEN